MSIPGIDVSNWQRTIDWPAVAASGIQFAAAKASEGTSYADPYFAANWAGIKAQGRVRIAYHFARPDRGSDPIEEARWFLKCVYAAGGFGPGDVFALDLEVGEGDLSDWALAWLQTVAGIVGCNPLLYSGHWFMRDHGLENDERFSPYGLWYGSYQETEPAPPAPWPFIAIWQYSADGVVSGITGKVDLDVFEGTVEQLMAYGVPQPAPPPVKPQPTNDDNVEMIRLVLAPDLPGLVAYAGRFA